jgi:hypothetical protein
MTTADDTGWVALEPTPWWLPLLGTNLFFAAGLPAVYALQLSTIFDAPLIWWIPIMIGTAIFILALIVVVARVSYPRAYLNPATSMLRAGRAQFRYAEFVEARLIPSTSEKRRALLLLLLTQNKLRATVLVRDARQRTLDPEVAALVQDLLRQSNIHMPVSPDDPSGRFARFNFPRNVTKDEALDLVAHPPTPADPIPIPPAR